MLSLVGKLMSHPCSVSVLFGWEADVSSIEQNGDNKCLEADVTFLEQDLQNKCSVKRLFGWEANV